MRKIVMITALCSFLFFMLAGYYVTLWIGEKDHRMEAAQANHTIQTKQVIRANTKMIYQYFYSKDRVIKEQIEQAPVFLQGLDMEQLKSVYSGWQIMFFSPEKVILRCKIEGLSSETYILGESDGFLAVFYEDTQKNIHLKEKTELPLSALPEGEVMQLREGIRVTGEENLAKLLSDFMS